MRTTTFYSVVASGASVGAAVGIIGAKSVGVFVPTVTSADLRLQGSPDGVGFAPTYSNTGSRFATYAGVGSVALAIAEHQLAFSYIKPDFGVAQTDNRTLTFHVKW